METILAIPRARIILWTGHTLCAAACATSKFITGQKVFSEDFGIEETRDIRRGNGKVMLSYHAPRRPSHTCLHTVGICRDTKLFMHVHVHVDVLACVV